MDFHSALVCYISQQNSSKYRNTAQNPISGHPSSQPANLHPTQDKTSLTLQGELITGVRRKRIQKMGCFGYIRIALCTTLQEKEYKQSITPFHLLTG